MSDYKEFDFPPELCCSPSPLVAIAGLDTINNAIHRSIWDAFHSPVGRESRAILNFFHLTSEYKFPPLSEKVTISGFSTCTLLQDIIYANICTHIFIGILIIVPYGFDNLINMELEHCSIIEVNKNEKS